MSFPDHDVTRIASRFMNRSGKSGDVEEFTYELAVRVRKLGQTRWYVKLSILKYNVVCWCCHSTSCLGKVSPGRCNWLHLQCAFITNASESDNGFSQCISFSWKLHSKIYTMYSNGSGTLHWVRREFSQPLHCSYFRRRHMLCCGAFATEDLQGAFVFAKNGQCNYSRNNWTTLAKWLTTGQAEGIVRVDSWAAWLTLYSKASFQCSHSNLALY